MSAGAIEAGRAVAGPAHRFLCDEMLGGLARWLRAAGYDAATIARGLGDRQVLACAVAERRLMLTCDRRMLNLRGARGSVVVLTGQGTEACARELGARLRLDWCADPFSRCLLCNLRLQPADAAQRERLPPTVQARAGLAQFCPGCRRLYWEGSHVARMQRRLASWARADRR